MLSRTRAGFSLIEILVSLAVIGSIVALYTAMLNTFRLTRTSAHQALALRIAQDELEQVRGGGYATLPNSGSFTHAQLAMLPESAGTVTVSTFNAQIKQVTTAVSWREPGNATSTTSLTTLVTESGGL